MHKTTQKTTPKKASGKTKKKLLKKHNATHTAAKLRPIQQKKRQRQKINIFKNLTKKRLYI